MQPIQLISIQHELAMAISLDYHLEPMLQKFSKTCSRRLGLSGITWYLKPEVSDPDAIHSNQEGEPELYLSVPKSERFSKTIPSATETYWESEGRHAHRIELKEIGFCVLWRETKPIEAPVIAALEPIAERLSRAIVAIAEHEALVTANNMLTETRARLEFQLHHDDLTGALNRTGLVRDLENTLRAEPTQNEDTFGSLLFLDLDRFKLVNDTLGHDAGDLLLKVVAERLQGCVRQGDIVSRFGGDEFTIVLNRVKSYSVVESVATKIHQTLSRPFVFLGKEMHVSTSVGIAMYPNDGEDIGVLLKNADIAMYRAKEKGDRYEFYEQKMEADIARRLGMENDLRGALERNEMALFYQPQEDLKTGELIGMEALVRWRHPVRGLVSPLEFSALAEETGQILELGQWVMRTACMQLKAWQEKGYQPVRMAVNLAGRQLESGQIIDEIAQVLEETGISGDQLELEITESTIMEHAEEVIVTLEKIKEMGVMLAVDDFGTGYSSLSYLKRFPIDMLKIDRAFVSDITSDKVDADIVTTIITLAHSLGVKVIAEGVETDLQKEFLTREGCDYMQGYLLGKPVPADEFEALFLKEKAPAV